MSALVSPGFVTRHGADATVAASPDALAKLRMFHTLDALRGVAAMTIVLFHAAFFYRIVMPAEGQIAVDLFFVMSGFIIAYRYEDDLRRGMGLGRFIKVRLIRLYPLFILGAVLGAVPHLVAVAAGVGNDFQKGMVESLPLAIFMLPSRLAMPRIGELYPLNYVAWSLALEIVVNVIYAATFRYWTLRRLTILLAVAFVGLCICAATFGSLKYGYGWRQAEVGPVRIAYGFAMGVMICRMIKSRPIAFRLPWWAILAAALAIFFFDPPYWKPAWELFAVTVLVPGIVVAAISNEPPKAMQGVCALAGIFSYVVYSLHAPFIGFFLRGEDRLHLDLTVQTPTETVAFSALLIAVCLVAHYGYDKPVRRLLTRRLLAGRAPKISADAPVTERG